MSPDVSEPYKNVHLHRLKSNKLRLRHVRSVVQKGRRERERVKKGY
jgi:hypothetical protein